MTQVTWQEQLERVRRRLQRVRDIDAGTVRMDASTTPLLEDDVRAFFVECWHLRDHLCESAEALCTELEVIDWGNAHPDLVICRLVANGIKHIRGKTVVYPQLRTTTVLMTVNDAIGGEPDPNTHGVRMVIEPGGEYALQVAEQAVKDWEELIRQKTQPPVSTSPATLGTVEAQYQPKGGKP